MAEKQHLYTLQYRLDAHPEGFTADVARAASEDGFGSCDKAILLSIIEPESGGSSTLVLSLDGATGGELDDNELFKAWSLLAHQLAQSKTLDQGRRKFASEVFELIRQAVLKGSNRGS